MKYAGLTMLFHMLYNQDYSEFLYNVAQLTVKLFSFIYEILLIRASAQPWNNNVEFARISIKSENVDGLDAMNNFPMVNTK